MCGNGNVFPQHTVNWATQTVLPVLDRSILGHDVERGDHFVTSGKSRNTFTNSDDVTRGVGAGDNFILDLERILASGNSDITEVQGDTSHFDENFVFSGGRTGLLESGELLPRFAASEAKGSVGSHFGRSET
jgi:hypothetical protein